MNKQQLRNVIRKQVKRLNESVGAQPLIGVGALSTHPLGGRVKKTNSTISEGVQEHKILADAAKALRSENLGKLTKLFDQLDTMAPPGIGPYRDAVSAMLYTVEKIESLRETIHNLRNQA
jgi:hypothetical protein